MVRSLCLNRFCDIAVVVRIDPHLLLRFLSPYKPYLVGQCGMNWPQHPYETNYRQLIQILMALGEDAPNRMTEGLVLCEPIVG